MLPKEIAGIIEKYDTEDYDFYVAGADYLTDVFVLDFILDIQNSEGAIFQVWTVEATGYRKSIISFEPDYHISLENNHPLLWEFNDTQCELYYSGECKNIEKLFYSLYSAHKEMVGKYQDFNIFFEKDANDIQPLQYTKGFLAKGAKTLMEKYAACLKDNGLDFAIIGERQPTYFDGEEHKPESKDLKVLIIGQTYIIAEQFSFTRREEKGQ
jgi:hypothetical protein